VSEQLRDDIYGPRFGAGALWGYGIALVLLLPSVVLFPLIPETPPLLGVTYVLCAVALACWIGNAIVQRRLRWRVWREGQGIEGVVVSRAEQIYNGFGAAAQPLFWLTVRYSVGGVEHTSKMQVTDRVYLHHRPGTPILIRVLPDRPTLWVPAPAPR
jgi:hypothetical protein